MKGHIYIIKYKNIDFFSFLLICGCVVKGELVPLFNSRLLLDALHFLPPQEHKKKSSSILYVEGGGALGINCPGFYLCLIRLCQKHKVLDLNILEILAPSPISFKDNMMAGCYINRFAQLATNTTNSHSGLLNYNLAICHDV